ncbi:MAG: thiamine phosphate synthase [Candidatus Eremiobacteraeota bacterium]|nr:thiamine phosphate synthase [Candidatus Eremiobacteraeota bacterium]
MSVAKTRSERARLSAVRIYLIADASPRMQPIEAFVRAAVAGGVGMVQLREKHMTDVELLDVARRYAAVCTELGIPFILNDRLDLALACGADGVHLGQDDLPVPSSRAIAGEDFIIGLSTHTRGQIDIAAHLPADYIGVGPIHATPTKQGRPAVGTALVSYAAAHAGQPFFAIGGIEPENVAELIESGARGVSVLRWISNAPDPRSAARALAQAMERARPTAQSAGS